jgi:hypothetical protein
MPSIPFLGSLVRDEGVRWHLVPVALSAVLALIALIRRLVWGTNVSEAAHACIYIGFAFWLPASGSSMGSGCSLSLIVLCASAVSHRSPWAAW